MSSFNTLLRTARRLMAFASVLLVPAIAFAQPANDNPCGGPFLTPGVTCTNTAGTSVAALPTAGVPAPGCGNYTTADVWYRVTVPAGGTVTITTSTGGATP